MTSIMEADQYYRCWWKSPPPRWVFETRPYGLVKWTLFAHPEQVVDPIKCAAKDGQLMIRPTVV